MKAAEIFAFLEELAPLSFQEQYDNAGLIVGDSNTDVRGIMVCLDCTEEVVEDAMNQNCNLIISHHPVVFRAMKRFNGKNYVERTVMKAIKNDVLIYAAHTNLDNSIDGVNARIAEQLGLRNISILRPGTQSLKKIVTFCPTDQAEAVRNAMFSAGAGSIGNYDQCSFNAEGEGTFRGNASSHPFVGQPGQTHHEPETRIETIVPEFKLKSVLAAMRSAHPYEEVAFDIYPLDNIWEQAGAGMIGELESKMDPLEFLQMLKEKMHTDCIRYTLPHKQSVERIAFCGGSGSFLLSRAIAAKADVFITGDFKYHEFFDADGRIIIADIGHYESEQFTVALLADRIGKKFPTFAPRFTRVKTNPVNYL